MRTLSKALEYLLVTALVCGVAYAAIGAMANRIAGSMTNSAEMIEKATAH